MKHAYLIIAHQEFQVLEYLISTLDDERNDIFVHVDKKVDYMPVIRTVKANLFFTEERIDVRWGDVSVIESEYALFARAAKEGSYAYYHLLSGVDLPIKSQDEIHHFFNVNQGKEFIGYSQYDYSKEMDRKVHRYHLFPKYFKHQGGISHFYRRVLRFIGIRLQYLVAYRRHGDIRFKKGTQWASVTHDFVAYLLAQKATVLKTYQHTFCSDEIYKQTLCWHSSFRTYIYCDTDESRGCLREVGWKDGQISDWIDKDYKRLNDSDALFARKFNSRYPGIIKHVVTNLN